MRDTPRLLALSLLACAATGCHVIKGNGEPGTETRTVSSFVGVDVDNGVEVDLMLDPEHTGDVELEVSADSNLIDHIETDIVGSSLRVDVDANVWPDLPMEVSGTVADLEYASADNGAEVIVDGIDRGSFDIESDNGADIVAAGTVDELAVSGDNGSDCDARELTATNVDVDIDNGADADICATNEVTGVIDNGADLRVHCGGDTSRVTTRNGGSVESRP